MHKSSHRNIIEEIHNQWAHKDIAFAIWEVRKATGFSTSSVIRTMKTLVKLNMIIHLKKPGFQGRNYKVNIRWPLDVKMAIENFELSKILKM